MEFQGSSTKRFVVVLGAYELQWDGMSLACGPCLCLIVPELYIFHIEGQVR